ncbi:hypothetical protein LCGC14_0945780 [marine sediment metagenome]|uniref:Uncharacterized protein n=1 Tax=marine sediment metagenome TaxID=412755 RepID=A0A0F9NIT2_9ZZZZ
MNIYQEFKSIVNKYSYREENIKKILNIFEGIGENQIISSDIIPNSLRIKEFLVLSDNIERALNIIHSKIREIQQDDLINSGSLFYFSQYGGSKTQFLNLVENETSLEFSNVITILFDDLYQINPINMFDKIFNQIIQLVSKIPKISEDKIRYNDFSTELRKYIGEIQVAIQQSNNLKQAEILVEKLRRIRNPELKVVLNELDELLHSTILVDSLDILNRVITLMQYCSNFGFVFLFLFDEVDLWLEKKEDELRFSNEFENISKLMKKVFEISDNRVNIFMVFACTDRVNFLLQTMQARFETTSPVASRLNRIYNPSNKILEPGNYGSKIERALINLSAFYHLANNRIEIDTEIIEKIIPKLSKNYNYLSRRIANSKMIGLLKNYTLLSQPIKLGLRNWKSNTQQCGNLLQTHLPSILNRLSIKFIRKDIFVDPNKSISRDKIDGYFVNYSLEDKEIKTFVEIKVSKAFKGDKAYQTLQFLQLNKEKELVLIVFSPITIDNLHKAINQYAENEGYEKSVYERLNIILIDNPLAFCAINGISRVSSDSSKLADFLDAFANWLEFFGDFSSQFREIKRKIGIDITKKVPRPEPTESGSDSTSIPELNPDEQTSVNLLSNLYHRRKFTPSGRMNKTTIQKFIDDQSLGIADLEKYLELMERVKIIEKITNAQVVFSADIINLTSIEELQKKSSNLFQRVRQNTGINSFV